MTRAGLQRALLVNALTKPVNVALPAAVVVASVVLGTGWLLVVAAAAYVALALLTFLDEGEARRVGERAYQSRLGTGAAAVDSRGLATPIAGRLTAAVEEESRIRRAIAAAQLPLGELDGEVRGLVRSLAATARRAQLVYDYLGAQDPPRLSRRIEQLSRSPGSREPAIQETIAALGEQLGAQQRLARKLEGFYAEMDRTVAQLGTVHARIVQMGVASGADDEQQLAGQVRSLREQVDAFSDGITEAYEREQTAGEEP